NGAPVQPLSSPKRVRQIGSAKPPPPTLPPPNPPACVPVKLLVCAVWVRSGAVRSGAVSCRSALTGGTCGRLTLCWRRCPLGRRWRFHLGRENLLRKGGQRQNADRQFWNTPHDRRPLLPIIFRLTMMHTRCHFISAR